MSEQEAIRVSGLCFRYSSPGREEQVLNDIHISVPAGQFLAVVGPSGCGKSTLLSLLAGLRQPISGVIERFGEAKSGPDLRVGVVFQHYSLFPWMTAKQNLIFGIRQAKKYRKKEAELLAQHFLEQVELKEAADKYPHQLSGGMQQRVAIARMMAMDADLFLMDEPFGALDTKTKLSLQQLLQRLWCGEDQKKTIVLVTHDIEEALFLADRIVFLRGGSIQADFTVPFERPRDRAGLGTNPEYNDLRRFLLNQFGAEKEREAEDRREEDMG